MEPNEAAENKVKASAKLTRATAFYEAKVSSK